MKMRLTAALAIGLAASCLGGCASGGNGLFAAYNQTYTFDNYSVALKYEDALVGCGLNAATLHNSGARDLPYVHTQLLTTKKDGGVTESSVDIHFSPTAKGEITAAAAIIANGAFVLGPGSCEQYQFKVTASNS